MIGLFVTNRRLLSIFDSSYFIIFFLNLIFKQISVLINTLNFCFFSCQLIEESLRINLSFLLPLLDAISELKVSPAVLEHGLETLDSHLDVFPLGRPQVAAVRKPKRLYFD